LLPATKSDSVTLSVKQDVGAASMFIDGLYIARDADRYVTYPTDLTATYAYPTTLRKFAVAAGVNLDLWRDWRASVFVTEAEDRTLEDAVLTSPMTPENAEKSLGTSRGIEAIANGVVASIPAGPVRLALGVGYRRESFSNAIGVTFDSLGNIADGERNIRYGFGELSVPLVGPSGQSGSDVLALTVSGRNERYSDFGGTTAPKIGLVYAPANSLKLRSTWGKAFRAPNLYDSVSAPQLVALTIPDPAAAGGSALALLRAGGNPSLRPETADAWSLGADYSGFQDDRLRVATTFFDIRYRNRISQIGNAYSALTDPFNAFFVTPSPSASYAQSVIKEYPASEVYNFSGQPLIPGNVAAIVDARETNVARQTARGADISINYRVDANAGSTLLFLDGTYLDLTQLNTPQSPSQTLSGLAFYPSKFRVRTGVTWKPALWALTGIVNYLPHETNTQVSPAESVSSWTTIDASVRYAPPLMGIWGGLNFNLAVLNLLNRDPPYVLSSIQGLNYDSSNVGPLGRLITLQVSKEW
jgi:outer membrane receptor protein involved in Fe transport